jgi:hypothetical protein
MNKNRTLYLFYIQWTKILLIITFFFILFNSYGQHDSKEKERYFDKFIPCRNNTKIVIKTDKEFIDLSRFQTKIIKVEKRSQMSIVYHGDYLACDTFDFYNIFGKVKRSLVVNNQCDEFLKIVYLDTLNVRNGCLKYDPLLKLNIKGFRRYDSRNQILIYYTIDNISFFYCILEFYDNKDDVVFIFDKNGIVPK